MPQSVLEAMLSFGWYLGGSGASERGMEILSLALDSARSQEDTLGELAALQLLGQLALLKRDFSRAANHFDALLRIGRRSRHSFVIASALHNHGELALSRGDAAMARGYFTAAERLYRQAGYSAGVTRARHHLIELADHLLLP